MDVAIAILSLLTGIVTGGIFRFLSIPVPAPPTLAGVLGIVGLFLGYSIVDSFFEGIDLLAALG